MHVEQPRALAGTDRWMNGRLYERCATPEDVERKRDRRAFFGSIHGTPNHPLTRRMNQAGCEPGITDLLCLPGAELPDGATPLR